MKSRCDALLLADKTAVAKKEKTSDVLAPAKRSVLLSLQNHWYSERSASPIPIK